jgi:dTDP-4-dehydrorhamnose 3,5-epimerase
MTQKFELVAEPLPGLLLLQNKIISDHRGYFERLFCEEELRPYIGQRHIAQINHSFTSEIGTVRGLHFQLPPYSEIKIVSCIRGSIFDVVIDLRKNSEHYLKWYGIRLDADLHRTLIIPEGFAHGFQSLSVDAEVVYSSTAAYDPMHESGLNPLDALFAIKWPVPVTNLSQQDEKRPFINSELPFH